MAQRYTIRVYTRTVGGQALSASENEVEDRIIQLSADLGGVPGDLDTDDDSSYMAAINELVSRIAPIELPMVIGAPGWTGRTEHDRDNLLYVATQGKLETNNYPGANYAVAEVRLPHGVELDASESKMFGNLAHASGVLSVTLLRRNINTGAVTSIWTNSKTGATGDVAQAFTGSDHTVDSRDYSYWLELQIQNGSAGNETELWAVKLVAT